MPQSPQRSPSPRLNLGRLKRKQNGGGGQHHNNASVSPRSHGSPTSATSPHSDSSALGQNGGGPQTPLSSFRLGGLLSQRKASRFGRIGSLLMRPDRRDSVRFDGMHGRKLVPVPEDLTHDEVRQVEDDFARFGPISSQLELTEFLTLVGENISEEELLVLLKRIVAERAMEDAMNTARSQQHHQQGGGDSSARGPRSTSILVPRNTNTPTTTTATTAGSAAARTNSLLAGSTSLQLSGADDDDELTPVQRDGHHARHGSSSNHSTSANKELRAVLRKRFLRPFFSLEDILVLLRHIKASVLLNRASLDEAKEVFDALCADGLGVINAAEFMHITKTFSLKLDVEQFIRDVDDDGSGQIELAEFRALLGRVSGGGRSGAASLVAMRGGQRRWAADVDGGDDASDMMQVDFLDSSANTVVVTNNNAISCGLDRANNSVAQYDGLSVAGSIVLDGVGVLGEDGGMGGNFQDIGGDMQASMLISAFPSATPAPSGGAHTTAAAGGWLTRSPTLASLQQQQTSSSSGDAGTALDAHLRQIKRDLLNADIDPLAGIEAAKPLASYIALQKRNSLAPLKIRLTQQQKKKEPSARDLRGSRLQRGGGHNVGHRQTNPRRLAPVEGHTTSQTTAVPAPSTATGAPGAGVSNRGGDVPSPASHKSLGLPPMLRPNRQPFHVAEGVFPEWRESYFQHMRPM